MQALTGMFSGRFRMTKREIVVLNRSVFGVMMSLGSVATCCRSVSDAVASMAEAIHEEVEGRHPKLTPLRHEI